MTHPGGRPSKYNPETLSQVWDGYKQNCIEKRELANISGFALFADCHRDTIYSYFALPEFIDTKNKIEADIENTAVQQGHKCPKSSLFNLLHEEQVRLEGPSRA